MTEIKSLLPETLQAQLKEMGEPAFRTGQIFSWLHKGVTSFEEMTNLPAALRSSLAQKYTLTVPEIVRCQESRLDGTRKYLWRLADGNCIESVFMRYHHGNTVCLSSQAGCRMGCVFCASAPMGKVRDLTPGEMLDQILFTIRDTGEPVSNLVLMGIGEPLDNYENVLTFLHLVNHAGGLAVGMRHIYLSTCGLVAGIDKLASERLQLTLSVSLHAPDDETRSRIMPANRSRGVDELFRKCQEYFQRTGRRISFEYAMIDGVNDTADHARLLSRRARDCGAHVNLIPLNHVEERRFRPSTQGHMKAFMKILDENGVNYTVRRTLGSDVDASCGQLRRKMQKTESQD